MDKRLNDETEKMFMKALADAKAYSRKMEEKRYNKLWKIIDYPCSLYDTLSLLTKYELDQIRKKFNFKNMSSMKKLELASVLSKLIPVEIKQVLLTIDQDMYDTIKTIINNSGILAYKDMPIEKIEAFRELAIIFPGYLNDEKVLFIPIELRDILSKIDEFEFNKIVKRNTEWIRLTHGMLYYYGIVETWVIKEKIEEMTKQRIDMIEFIKVLNIASDFYRYIMYSSRFGYKVAFILDEDKIVEEQRKRPNLDYYPFTKNQLLKANSPDYLDRTPQMNIFINFLLRNYDLSDAEVGEMALNVYHLFNLDSTIQSIIEYLGNFLEFPSFDFVQELSEKLIELYNSTRQWALKGYTPNELFEKERKYSNPFPVNIKNNNQGDSNVINLKTRTKIGRNDPCPCGSGKKYKRCCGK